MNSSIEHEHQLIARRIIAMEEKTATCRYRATYGAYSYDTPVRPTGRWKLVWSHSWKREPDMYVEHKSWWGTKWLHEDMISFRPIPVEMLFNRGEIVSGT